jgi:uncharacterized protein
LIIKEKYDTINIMVKDEIVKLIALQEMDSIIHEWEEAVSSFPLKKNEIEKPLNDAVGKNDSAKKEHKKLQLQRKENELELEGLDTEIKKLQGQLHEVKTNKEYTSIIAEIEALKKKKAKTEDLILSVMEKDEMIESQLSDSSSKNSLLAKEVEQKLKEETEKTEAIKAKLKEMHEKRREAASSVKKDIYEKYERILRGKKNGVAICRLENGSCSGCRVFVPTYIEEKVKEKKELVHCENCSRILY